MSSFFRLGLVGWLALSLGGCAAVQSLGFSKGPEPEPTPAASEDNGIVVEDHFVPLSLDSPDDHTVRVVMGSTNCTGTLIAKDQVLTAHHCVAARDEYGDILDRDAEPSEIRVELGGDFLPWGEVGVRVIVAPSCGHKAGSGDLAILVLDRELGSVPTLSPRLDAPPEVGEPVRPIGFGRCASDHNGISRHQRPGGRIESVSPDRFKLDAAICPGDSGGPAVSLRSGDIVGVTSASVMDGSPNTRGRSEFTRLDHFRPVFANAKLVSEGTPLGELPPIDCQR